MNDPLSMLNKKVYISISVYYLYFVVEIATACSLIISLMNSRSLIRYFSYE